MAGRWYWITVPIDTTDAVVKAGHRLGLVVTQSDLEYTSPTPTGATATIDPAGSTLRMRVGGAGAAAISGTTGVLTAPGATATTAPAARPAARLLPLA